jgi:hypothetical protein
VAVNSYYDDVHLQVRVEGGLAYQWDHRSENRLHWGQANMSTKLRVCVLLSLVCGGCHLIFPFDVMSSDAARPDGATSDSATADHATAPDGTGAADATSVPNLVQTGEQLMSGAAKKTLSVGAINLDHAFVFCSFRSINSEPHQAPTCQLGASGLTIGVGNATANAHVRWHVVQLAAAKTRRGHVPLQAGEKARTITIKPVDLSKSFALVTSRIDLSDRNADQQRLVAARLVNATTLELTRGEVGTLVDVEWQIVQLDSARVIGGVTTLDQNTGSLKVTIKPVARSRSFLLHSVRAAPETNGHEARYAVQGRIADSTTIELARGAKGAQLDVHWFVVELGAGRALHGFGSVGSTATSATQPLGDTVDVTRSLPLVSPLFVDNSHGSFQDQLSLTARLSGPSAMVMERDDAGSVVSCAWSVVEFPP